MSNTSNTTNTNKIFYSQVFDTWNNEATYYWDGFYILYPIIEQLLVSTGKTHFRILDVGCANGRWFNFIEMCFPEYTFEKIGIDLVDFKSIHGLVNDFDFKVVNIEDSDEMDKFVDTAGYFDIITLFGVYHHIQGREVRQTITKKLSTILNYEGRYIFTRWNFLKMNRLRNHILYPNDLEQLADCNNSVGNYNNSNENTIPKIDYLKWEKGDYYLKWDKSKFGIRYANMLDNIEIAGMLYNSILSCRYTFDSDDKQNNRNSYYVCKKGIDLKNPNK